MLLGTADALPCPALYGSRPLAAHCAPATMFYIVIGGVVLCVCCCVFSLSYLSLSLSIIVVVLLSLGLTTHTHMCQQQAVLGIMALAVRAWRKRDDHERRALLSTPSSAASGSDTLVYQGL
jgi:hypothetical protein